MSKNEVLLKSISWPDLRRFTIFYGNTGPIIKWGMEEVYVPIEFVPESEKKSPERPANQANQSKSTHVSKPSGKFSGDDKKTCGQMTSCEEAKYHLETCGDNKPDKDGNGVPCESICQ